MLLAGKGSMVLVGCRRLCYSSAVGNVWGCRPLNKLTRRRFTGGDATTVASGGGGGISTSSSYQYLLRDLMIPPQEQLLGGACQSQTTSSSSSSSPSLLLFSPSEPKTGFLCDPPKLGGRIQINKEQMIELPDSVEHFCFGSSQGYLFYTPNLPSPTHILALNPITGQDFRLPAYPDLPFSVKNGARKRIINVKPKTEPEEEEDDDDEGHEHESDDDDRIRRLVDDGYYYLYTSRAVLSPSHDIVVLLRWNISCFFRVNEGGRWTTLHTPAGGVLTDCFFHNGYLHATNHLGNLFLYDLDGPSPGDPVSSYLTTAFYPISQFERYDWGTKRYFVMSPDGRGLFFVVRGVNPIDDLDSVSYEDYALRDHPYPMAGDDESPFRAKDFIVLKFFATCGKWKQVHDLGGLALFVGPGQTVSLSAHDFPALVEPDCIYFTDDCRTDHIFQPWRVGDTGVFNVRDESIRFYELEDGSMKLNWPPPLWFVPTAPQS